MDIPLKTSETSPKFITVQQCNMLEERMERIELFLNEHFVAMKDKKRKIVDVTEIPKKDKRVKKNKKRKIVDVTEIPKKAKRVKKEPTK